MMMMQMINAHVEVNDHHNRYIIITINMITWMTKFIIIKEVEVNALPRVVGVRGNPPGIPIHLSGRS